MKFRTVAVLTDEGRKIAVNLLGDHIGTPHSLAIEEAVKGKRYILRYRKEDGRWSKVVIPYNVYEVLLMYSQTKASNLKDMEFDIEFLEKEAQELLMRSFLFVAPSYLKMIAEAAIKRLYHANKIEELVYLGGLAQIYADRLINLQEGKLEDIPEGGNGRE